MSLFEKKHISPKTFTTKTHITAGTISIGCLRIGIDCTVNDRWVFTTSHSWFVDTYHLYVWQNS